MVIFATKYLDDAIKIWYTEINYGKEEAVL